MGAARTLSGESPNVTASGKRSGSRKAKKVWIDLDNSPHVPFFAPIIAELEKRGYAVAVTARDCFQVCELADLLHLKYKLIGHHYGKHKLLKLAGLGVRTLQLAPTVLREKPDVALSHGSRSQVLLSRLLRMTSIVICDYEFAKGFDILHPSWVMVPDVITTDAIKGSSKVLHYPGIKEDVYVPSFQPNPSIKQEIGIRANDLVVTLRPPANEAHYHNPESEALLDAVLDRLDKTPNAKIVLLPRNHRQEAAIRNSWGRLFVDGKMVVPPHAIDGLNLIWHSDLVISGGGTMNREAAALGVPVYSIFRGKIGAVDRYLVSTERLTLIENVEDVKTKIELRGRQRAAKPDRGNRDTLNKIVDNVVKVIEVAGRV